MPPGCLPVEVYQARPTGTRPQGRRTRWSDYISELAWERLGVIQNELEEGAGNRVLFSPYSYRDTIWTKRLMVMMMIDLTQNVI